MSRYNIFIYINNYKDRVSYLFLLTNLSRTKCFDYVTCMFFFLVDTGSALFTLRNVKKEVSIDSKAE